MKPSYDLEIRLVKQKPKVVVVRVYVHGVCLLYQVDEDLAKINVDDPRYQRDEQDGFANGVRLVCSVRMRAF